MLRFLSLCLMIALAGPGHAQPRTPVAQHQQTAVAVWEVMRLEKLAPILRDEAMAEGTEVAATMFPRGGTGRWADRIRAIHDPVRIKALFLTGVAAAMPAARPDDVQKGLAFYGTVFGQRILALEASARVAMLDADVEAQARDAFAKAVRQRDPRAARIIRLIQVGDLIEPNVAGGLNAAVAFSRGLQAGGGFAMPLSEAEIVRDAWAQESRMRADTEGWISAYLFYAYAVLGDAELDRYIAYAGSAGGQALSRLMFAGFDAVFAQTSHDMGLATAAEMQGRQL